MRQTNRKTEANRNFPLRGAGLSTPLLYVPGSSGSKSSSEPEIVLCLLCASSFFDGPKTHPPSVFSSQRMPLADVPAELPLLSVSRRGEGRSVDSVVTLLALRSSISEAEEDALSRPLSADDGAPMGRPRRAPLEWRSGASPLMTIRGIR